MNYEQLRCENCGALLSANPNNDIIFCLYCNTTYEKNIKAIKHTKPLKISLVI